ncbi:MAG: sporulation protein [Saprospiraceae bacterium]|nr:sporulation protein [Saprospiraceae bacterium]
MINKFKDMVGIEGVKIKLEIPSEVKEKDGNIIGRVIFHSKRKQQITELRIRLLEKYSRGKGEQRLSDEYELSKLYFDRPINIEADDTMELDFELPIKLVKSDMDEFEGRFLIGRLATAAKYFRSVKSEYRVEVEAKVKGILLNPFTMQEINIR